MREPMRICVVGAGAIGGLLAYRLAAAGHAVSVIARGAHRDAIEADGLTLVDHAAGGKRGTVRIAAAAEPAVFGVQDVVFMGLKAHAIPAMLPRIAPLLGPGTTVVPAINGVPWWYFMRHGGPWDGRVVRHVDPHGTMARAIPSAAIVGCVVHAGAEVKSPGVVHHTAGREFILGEIDRGLADAETPRVRALGAALDAAGLVGTVSKDIRVDVWSKLIGNLSFNPVAALSYADMGRICASGGLLSAIRPMLHEGIAVAKALGIDIAMTPDARIDVARRLGSTRISMHQDFEARRTPEIDAITGAVIDLADLVDVPVPITRMIDALVRERAKSEGLLGV